MIITGFIQVRNEMESGHLNRFFTWNESLFDNIVAFDDKSSDGSAEFLKGKVDLLIEAKFCSFASELANKNRLIERARENFPETNWYLWLDADEVLFTSRDELEILIKEAESNHCDGISLPLTNLYKSEYFFRTDSSFDTLSNVRIWKNSPDLHFSAQVGLHRSSHPTSIKKIFYKKDLYVTHFGFANKDLIAKKFASYKLFGQQGLNLWRLINEQGMLLNSIQDRIELLGSRAKQYFKEYPDTSIVPKESTMFEYLTILQKYKKAKIKNRPYVSIICPVSMSVHWIEFQYGELLALKKEISAEEVEIIFVANNAPSEVIDYLVQNNIPHVIAPDETNGGSGSINSVYCAYNYGASKAEGEYLLFVNCDMAYAPSFLHNMALAATPGKYVVPKLIEPRRQAQIGFSVQKNFGKSILTFRRSKFYKFASKVSERSQELGRGSCMPAIVFQKDFVRLGGFPMGDISSNSFESYVQGGPYLQASVSEPKIAGDYAFIARFKTSGGFHITDNSAIVYHFQEYEKPDSKYRSLKTASGIAIANDQLIGINGELTLWNYLIEDLSNQGIRTKPVALGVGTKLPYKVSRRDLWKKPRARIIFRNATFLKPLRGPWRQVVLIQDKVQSPRRILRQQKIAVNSAATRVTNSQALLDFPKSKSIQKRHLLVLPVNPLWEASPLNSNQIKTFQAVFVGAFNETKGWSEVKKVIASYPDCNFLCISKYTDDEPNFELGIIPKNVKILRCLETKELISAVDSAKIFLVGSPFETQCLAAIEAATRNLAVCMKDTGLLSKLPEFIKDRIGIFDSDLVSNFGLLLHKLESEPESLSPRHALVSAGLANYQLRMEWMNMLLEELEDSFIFSVPTKFSSKIKSKIPNQVKSKIREVFN